MDDPLAATAKQKPFVEAQAEAIREDVKQQTGRHSVARSFDDLLSVTLALTTEVQRLVRVSYVLIVITMASTIINMFWRR